VREIDKIDQLPAVSGNIKRCTNVVVNVGDASHDKERGCRCVRSELASLEEVNAAFTKMEEPSKERNFSDVKEMIPFTCIQTFSLVK